jgi:hypothetical protein
VNKIIADIEKTLKKTTANTEQTLNKTSRYRTDTEQDNSSCITVHKQNQTVNSGDGFLVELLNGFFYKCK